MMPKGRKIQVIAGDAGGANALWPVVAALRNSGAEVSLAGYAVAPALWRQRGEAVLELSAATSVDDAFEMLRAGGATVMLCGTSLNGLDLERRFVLAARRAGIPSLALLDFWSNYRARFSSDGRNLDCLPDRIAVMDEQARAEMQAEGFPASILETTGQPLFDDLAHCRQASTPAARAATRQVMAVGDERWVLFASQPLREVYGTAGSAGWLGYDELDIVPPLLSSLARINEDMPLRLTLLPHPRESRSRCASWLETLPWAALAPSGMNNRELVLAADLVIGMNSMLLMESALLGTATLSVQLGLRGVDCLSISRAGKIPRVECAEALEGTLRNLLAEGQIRNRHLAGLESLPRPGKAAERVAELVNRMTCRETL